MKAENALIDLADALLDAGLPDGTSGRDYESGADGSELARFLHGASPSPERLRRHYIVSVGPVAGRPPTRAPASGTE